MGKYERSFNHQNLVDAIVTSIAKFSIATGANAPRGNAIVDAYSRSIVSGSIVCWMRDRCAVNEAAMHLSLRTHRGSKNMACLSHTPTYPGEMFLLKNLQKFKEDICGLMHQSLAAAAHWVIFIVFLHRFLIYSFTHSYSYYFSYRHSSLEKHLSTLVLHVCGQLTSFMSACYQLSRR